MDIEFPLGEMVMINEADLDEMESDLDHWITACSMLSDLLKEHGIDHEVNDLTVAAYNATQMTEQ